ncbi:Glycolipid transfer protein domain - like 1 [Theobroma cacao]|nr:Glycolipid transfer protein domain - like 1 [Theobroma cacao]
MVDLENEKTLRKISDAFKELAATVNSQAADMEMAPFSRACSLVSPLFGCLGIAFKFAEMDYVAKVDDLAEASKSIATLNAMLDRDVEGNCVRKAGSHTRNLLRVKRGLDMVRVLFEQILVTE